MNFFSRHHKYAVLLYLPDTGRDASCIWMRNIFERIPGIKLNIQHPIGKIFRFDEIKGFDLVICLRNLCGPFAEVLRTAKKYGIKTGYAVDDNLVEYFKTVPELQDFLEEDSLSLLAEADYIICSNPSLTDYYGRLTTHRVLTVPTNVPKEDLPDKVNASEGPTVIGYFGGPKGDVFSMVSESLRQICNEHQEISIVSGGVDLNLYGVPSLFKEFSLDYHQALAEMKQYRPHILLAPNSPAISPQEPNVNLEYKSIIKFLDATRLGGVLLASRLSPYRNMNEEQGVTTVENTVDAWTEALRTLINDEELRRRLYQNARQYLIDHHESSSIAGRIGAELFPKKPKGVLTGTHFRSSV